MISNNVLFLLTLLILLFVQHNRRLLKKQERDNEKLENTNIFLDKTDYRASNGFDNNTILLGKDIVVYDDWERELRLVVYPTMADSFPYLITLKKDVSLKEAVEIYEQIKEHYNKGGRIFKIE